MTRAELMARLSSSEYLEWMLLEQIEPYGETAEYLRAGIISSTIGNFSGYREKNRPPFKPADFMLKSIDEPKGRSADELKEKFDKLMLLQNAKAERERIERGDG